MRILGQLKLGSTRDIDIDTRQISANCIRFFDTTNLAFVDPALPPTLVIILQNIPPFETKKSVIEFWTKVLTNFLNESLINNLYIMVDIVIVYKYK